MARQDLPIPAALVRLSFLVQSLYAEVCAGYGLTVAQAQLMCVLKDQPRGMSELTELLRLEKSSVTGLVDRVERRGYLRRGMAPDDRRAVTVALTAEGRRITLAFYDQVCRRLLGLVADLPVTDRTRLRHIATRIVLDQAVPAVFGSAAS